MEAYVYITFSFILSILIATCTASTSATDTLDHLILLELRFRHSTDTGGVEVRFLSLDAAKATKLQTQTC